MIKFDELYKLTQVDSGVNCEGCPVGCCPDGLRERIYILFVPGELEYLKEKGVVFGDRVQVFQREGYPPVEYSTNCPFLTSQGMCGVYKDRPLDCRTFPLFIRFEGKLPAISVDYDRCPRADKLVYSHRFAIDLSWTHVGMNVDPLWLEAVALLDKELL